MERSVSMALVFYYKDMLEKVAMQRTQQFSTFVSLYGGQLTLLTQLIKPSYLAILPPTQHHSFFRNLPPYTLWL